MLHESLDNQFGIVQRVRSRYPKLHVRDVRISYETQGWVETLLAVLHTMKIDELLQLTEGRRLEFKITLPSKSDLAKTVIAFANDAGGHIYIGVQDNPRSIAGLPEDELVELEEQISNIIFETIN